MAIERWGSLSVADHNDTTALTANVLLYDRLVMPIYTEARDRNEREYWDQKGWNPDLQNQRREQLGDLIIECAWDETRRQSYTERNRDTTDIPESTIYAGLRRLVLWVGRLFIRWRRWVDCFRCGSLRRLMRSRGWKCRIG